MLGVAPGMQVVALDRQGGAYAARLWWMLRWLGHAEVAVLDGGYRAWLASGGEPSTLPVAPVAGAAPYPDRPSLVGSIAADALGRRLGQAMVLDARSAERFRGEKEPIDPVAGRIPGAFNRFHASQPAARRPASSRRRRLREELQALLGGRPPGEVVHSCGSGVTACHNLLAMEHAGLARIAALSGLVERVVGRPGAAHRPRLGPVTRPRPRSTTARGDAKIAPPASRGALPCTSESSSPPTAPS